MDVKSTVSQSDEEEDLEALRLAALQSLKKNVAPPIQSPTSRGYANNNRRFRQGHSYGQSGRFQSNRVGQHSNLIPLTTSDPKTPRSQEPVFRLPQDKYAAKNNPQDTTGVKKSDSKFDRYNDTDKSDEEDSEDELLRLHSDEEEDDESASPRKLERSDSLEALMQELDDEIKGASKPKVEKSEMVEVESVKDKSIITVQEPISSTVKAEEAEVTSSEEAVVKPAPENPPEDNNKIPECVNTQKPSRSYHRGKFYNKRGRHQNFNRQAPIQLPVAPFLINPNPLAFLPNRPPPPIFPNNHSLYMPMNTIPSIPPFYTRPVSPLQINTETLQTQTRAPLSPRSAAFVLQNRAIIEKRKRRSYSRSPSPRGRSLSPRRSRSPLSSRKRSMSPPMRKRSPSPLRKRSKSPLRKRSLSPKRRNYSPKRRSASPIKRRSVSPKRNDKNKEPNNTVPKTKPSIRDRLGLKSNVKPEETEIKEKPVTDSPSKNDKPLDPVLEARKRKFESKEIKVRGGIIRLKPKEEPKPNKVEPNLEKPQETETTTKTVPIKTEVVTEEPATKKDSQPKSTARGKVSLEEDVLLEDDELDLEAQVDLFSDEDLISEDELTPIKDDPNVRLVELPEKVPNGKRKIRLSPVKTLSKDRSRSPSERSKTRKKPRTSSKKLTVKMERHPKKFDRKIEIKLKNPSKSEPDSSDEIVKDREKPKRTRKVEVGNSKNDFLEDDDDDVTEIIVESDETENSVSREGDLRAQLSKKRAEKLQKAPTSQDVASRLLQNALENALPIKKSKKSRSKDLSSSEGKPPIHLRLGIEYNSDIFAPTKPKRRSKKRKHVESEPQ